MNGLRVFTNSEVDAILDYTSLIESIEESFGKVSEGSGTEVLDQPDRRWLSIPQHDGLLGSMPVCCNYNNFIATKLLTYYPENKDCPTHHALIIAFDGKNGRPRAVLEGETITAKRTAAASSVATKYLVNGKPEILAILGSGIQAKSHFDALSHLYKFKQIRIWSRTKSSAEKLACEIGDIAVAYESVQEAVNDADVIVTASLSSTPILMADWVKKGAHINAVGACRPDMQELDGDLMRTAVIYVDSVAGASNDSGDLVLSKAPIYAEIGEVVNGKKEAISTETTIFKSVGMAIQDAVAAKIVVDKSS